MELARESWTSCNESFTGNLTRSCDKYLKYKLAIADEYIDFFGNLVKSLVTTIVETAEYSSCVASASIISTAVDSTAPKYYLEAQDKQLRYQKWLADLVRKPSCSVTGTPDNIILTIDSWNQDSNGIEIAPIFSLNKGLEQAGVNLTQVTYNQWKGSIDRLGTYEFIVINNYTQSNSKCGVVISELAPSQLPEGIIDTTSVIDTCPDGFRKHDVDLNAGAGGEYIYFCEQAGKHVQMITDVTIIGGDNSLISCPTDYIKEPLDLNKGSGGFYIYLCKKREFVGDGITIPLRNIHVYNQNDPGNSCPEGYEWIDFDLNKGAGGDFVYLCKR
ncbi:MAG: hypothetical protein R3B45_00340 [Bdellovibrionota bacterium]